MKITQLLTSSWKETRELIRELLKEKWQIVLVDHYGETTLYMQIEQKRVNMQLVRYSTQEMPELPSLWNLFLEEQFFNFIPLEEVLQRIRNSIIH